MQSSHYRTVKHFTIRCEQRPQLELTPNSYRPLTEKIHFVQLLIAFRKKSAASNSTSIIVVRDRQDFSFLLDEWRHPVPS